MKTRSLVLLAFFVAIGAALSTHFVTRGKGGEKESIRGTKKVTVSRGTYDEEQEKIKVFAKTLKPGDCFRDEYPAKSEYSFEKETLQLGHTYVVLAADKDALLIAQPEPECRELAINSAKCHYWFRTMTLDYPFLLNRFDVKIACTQGNSRAEMIRRLKSDLIYRHRFSVEE